MMQNEFLTKLEELLSRVPELDRKEMLYDYQEHFEIGLANGKSQRELMEELGDPHVIARDLLAEYRIGRTEKEKETETDEVKDKPSTNIFRSIIAGVSLSLFNLIFIIGPVAGLFGAYVALCAVSFALTVLPLVILTSYFLGYSYETFAVNFFVSLTAISLGLLMSIGMIQLGKLCSRVILRYIKFNVKVIKGGQAA
ncbi:HAAS signaling domain-containing protein [Neobacillus sp. D3-1R]|uniref:HAAS signaling domain-containing protein n=1 Tax=Neobacillus sp. D3-1R TaxID=3445778 RepID=UPI003F9F6B4D